MSKTSNAPDMTVTTSAVGSEWAEQSKRLTGTSTKWRNHEKKGATLMHEVAVLTNDLVSSGRLGRKGDPGVMITSGDYAKKFQRSPSWVTLMKRLGLAAVKGINPVDTPDAWAALIASGKTGANGAIRETLESETATAADVEAKIAEIVEAKAAETPKKKGKQDSKQDESGTVRITPGNLAVATEQFVANAATMLGQVSAESLLAIEDSAKALLQAVEAELAKTVDMREKATA